MGVKYGWNYNTGEYLLELNPENIKFGKSDVVYNPDGSITWKNNGSSQPYVQFVLPEEARCHMGKIVIEYINPYSHSLGKAINYDDTKTTDSELVWANQFNDYTSGKHTFEITISDSNVHRTYALKVFTAEQGPNSRGLTIYSIKFVYAIGLHQNVIVKSSPFQTDGLAKKIFFAAKLDHIGFGESFNGCIYACNNTLSSSPTWEDVVSNNNKCTITISSDQTSGSPGCFIVGVYEFSNSTSSQNNAVALKVEMPSQNHFVSISGMALKYEL